MDFILDDMIFSFSRIDTFNTCPKCFYLQYIKCLKGEDGAFGQFGSLCHDVLEKYAKGKLEAFEMSKEYKNNFDKVVTCDFPKNKYVDLREQYFEKGLSFFDNFEGYEDVKILGVENEYAFKVGKYNFIGKIDLETDNKIIDYKTKKASHLLRLTKKHCTENYITLEDGRYLKFDDIIQLLLYCIPYKDKHGEYPEYLVLDLIKANDKYVIKFEKYLLEKAVIWTENKIEEIYSTTDYTKGENADEFWCNVVCGQRYNCPHSDRYVE